MSFDFLDSKDKGSDMKNDVNNEEFKNVKNLNTVYPSTVNQQLKNTPNPYQNESNNNDKINQNLNKSGNFSNNTFNSINKTAIDKSNHLRNCNNQYNTQTNANNQLQIEINTPGSNSHHHHHNQNDNGFIEIINNTENNSKPQQNQINNFSFRPNTQQQVYNPSYVPPQYIPVQNTQFSSPYQQPPQQFTVQYPHQYDQNIGLQNEDNICPQSIETKTCCILFLIMIIIFLIYLMQQRDYRRYYD